MVFSLHAVAACADMWVSYDGGASCYGQGSNEFYESALMLDDAKFLCQRDFAANLPILNSVEEKDYLSDLWVHHDFILLRKWNND